MNCVREKVVGRQKAQKLRILKIATVEQVGWSMVGGGLNGGQPVETWMTKDSGQVEEWTGAHIFLLTSERSTNRKTNERSLSKPWRILVKLPFLLPSNNPDTIKKRQNPARS